MQALIMRHGEASYHAQSDSQRALTDNGRRQTAQIAHWLLGQINAFDYVLVSPYRRAQQTLAVFQSAFPLPMSIAIETLPALTPNGDAQWVSHYLTTLAIEGASNVLVVSHLPLVGHLVSELCNGVYPPMFSTSSIACVQVDAEAGQGKLVWHQSPDRSGG